MQQEYINQLLSNDKSVYVTQEIKKIEILGCSTLIMADDKEDQFRRGYINITKFVSNYQQKNPDERVKQIRDWQRRKEAKEDIALLGDSCIFSLKIQGGNNKDIQGTYFHPDLVLKVLMWSNPKLCKQMEQSIQDEIQNENALNRIVDEVQQKYKQLKKEKTLTLDIVDKMINQLKPIKSKLKGEYRSNCSDIIIDLQDDQKELNQVKYEMTIEQQTMISGHIYQKEIDFEKISELCQKRLDELNVQDKAEEQSKLQKLLTKIAFLSEEFKYIGLSRQYVLNGIRDPREQNHNKSIEEIIQTILNLNEVKKEPKYLLLSALYLLVNEMIPSFVGKLQIEDVFKTVKLEENITNVDVLAQREAYYIRKEKPLINGIKYNKSNKSNSELRNVHECKVMQLEKQMQDLQEQIVILTAKNQDKSLNSVIKESQSKFQKIVVQLNKERSKLNAIPKDDELVSCYAEIPDQNVRLQTWPQELIQEQEINQNINESQVLVKPKVKRSVNKDTLIQEIKERSKSPKKPHQQTCDQCEMLVNSLQSHNKCKCKQCKQSVNMRNGNNICKSCNK